MERSNQFLEEHVTTYGPEQNEEASSGDIAYVYSGEALDMQDVFRFSCVEEIEPVIVAGEQDSGKTTLEVMMYRLFLEGKNERFQFAGSRTMKGFWERSHNLLKKSGVEKPDVPRTLRAEKKFLHLAVVGGNGKRKHLVFADYAGELFEDASCIQELGDFFAGAANVVVTLDGEKISNYRKRIGVFSHVRILLKRMQAAEILSENTHLYVVCTKFDKMKESGKADAAMQFLEKEYERLRQSFAEAVGQMSLVCLCAYGIGESEEREKMENLLDGFVKEREMAVSVSPEEQLQINRQMDKFRVRR